MELQNVLFSALTLLIGWQKGHPACIKSCCKNLKSRIDLRTQHTFGKLAGETKITSSCSRF